MLPSGLLLLLFLSSHRCFSPRGNYGAAPPLPATSFPHDFSLFSLSLFVSFCSCNSWPPLPSWNEVGMCKIVRLDTLFITESLLSRFISSPRFLSASSFVSSSTFLTFFRKFLLLSVSFLLLEHFSHFFLPSFYPFSFPAFLSQHLFSLPTFFLISLRSPLPHPLFFFVLFTPLATVSLLSLIFLESL